MTPIESFMLKLDFQSCLVVFGGKDLSTTSQNVFYEGVFNDWNFYVAIIDMCVGKEIILYF